MELLKTMNKGGRTQYQGLFEIFGALSVADVILERYAITRIGGSY